MATKDRGGQRQTTRRAAEIARRNVELFFGGPPPAWPLDATAKPLRYAPRRLGNARV